jgi:YesN/AraC family two-component response regulator
LQLKILVVDDEKNIREGLGQALEYEDYKVELAADGKEAIAIVNQGGVDLVVTDLRMPGWEGRNSWPQSLPATPIYRSSC